MGLGIYPLIPPPKRTPDLEVFINTGDGIVFATAKPADIIIIIYILF
jgi:hypothetical protein